MKVVFDLSSSRIVIEGEGPELIKVLETARDVAPHVNQIQITSTATQNLPPEPRSANHASINSSDNSGMTMRRFARSLSLDNLAERISALAYYANKIEGRTAFSPKDMDGWFTMCGFQKPSQMPVGLFDTKRKYGYLDNISRGNWRISNQGENLIIGKIEMRDTSY